MKLKRLVSTVLTIGILFSCIELTTVNSAAATATTISVTKATKAVARSIHSLIIQGKSVTLKVLGNKAKSQKKVTSLQNKIKKVNEQGVIFQYAKGKKTGKYYTYKISSSNAKLYKYSVAFIKKLHNKFFKDKNTKREYEDRLVYKNRTTRRLRQIYDYLVDTTRSNAKFVTPNIIFEACVGFSPKTTQATPTLQYNKTYADFKNYIIKNERLTLIDIYRIPLYDLYSFEEFRNLKGVESLLNYFTYPDIDNKTFNMLSTKFCDLSDAMKVYFIAQSEYFSYNTQKPKFGVQYKSGVYRAYHGLRGMQTLYNNKAKGVCQVYAMYEAQVWIQLGINYWMNASSKINHAWTVVKVKNSKGKTLWIPFDYGIGPTQSLAVSESQLQYVNSEAKRYKLYLNGIKGAPKKKNFKNSDFN